MKQAIPKFLLVIALPIWCCLWAEAALGAGTGLLGEYFDNIDFTNLRLTRTNSSINFDWGTNAPDPSMGADTFSVRWSGRIEPRYSETYTFYLTADDGARLWVDNRLLVLRTMNSSNVLEMAGTIDLKAGECYNIQLEYMEETGTALVKLGWSSPSQVKEIIPQSQLYPIMCTPEAGAILQEVWLSLSGTSISALTNNTNFPNHPDGREFLTSFECMQPNWADNYGKRISGYLLPPVSGNYVFAVSGDEVVQLYLSTGTSVTNKQLIAWTTAPTGFREFSNAPNQISTAIPLVARQKYYVELLQKESTGDDHFSVAWQTPASSELAIIPAEALVQPGLDRTPPSQTRYFDTLALSHPRLFVTAEKFEWLRRTVASNSVPQLASWWGSISNAANAMLTQPVNTYTQDARGTMLDVSRSVLGRVQTQAVAFRLTGNSNFAERAWSELQAAANFPNWNHTNHFLDTAEMTHAFALGYDWLYDYWTPVRRDVIRNAIISKGLNQSLTIYTNLSSWASTNGNNWNLVCNGGMALGALAVGTESESLTKYILWRAVISAGPVMRHWTSDNGGWYEGPGYWDYTTDYNIRLLAGLESALGSDFGLSATPGLWNSGLFPIYMVGPTKLSFNFADANVGNMRGPPLFWMARRFNRPEYACYERTNAGPEVLDLLWYDSRGTDFRSSGLSTDNCFRGPTRVTPYYPAEAVSLRTRWQDSDAMFVGFRAGEIGASHGHLDAGSFVFDALGRRWAHDLGPEDYDLPDYFGDSPTSARWTYYRVRAEGHNTLVINPTGNLDQTLDARPPVILFSNGEETGKNLVVADLTSAYNVNRVWRGLALDPDARSLLVQDEIEATTPATVWWFMHIQTTELSQIDPDGTAVMLTSGSDRLWMKIVSGGGVFTLRSAVPLPGSPSPSGQSANSNYRKLAIQLNNVVNTTLAVLMVPLHPGENPPSQFPALGALRDWGRAMNNTPPVTATTNVPVSMGSFLDLDLRNLVSDAESAASELLFQITGTTNGTVSVLEDGHTVRFIPPTNFYDAISLQYTVMDAFPDPRLLFYYSFDPPLSENPSAVADASGHYREGSLEAFNTGSFSYQPLAPAALGLRSVQSVRLISTGTTNAARLSRNLPKSEYDLSDNDWTFATWFRRESTNTDDYLLYIGYGDGYGGSGDEFYLYCPKKQRNLSVAHWTGAIQDVSLFSAAVINTGEWHHTALVFNRSGVNSGTLQLYLDGAPVMTPTNVNWALTQNYPLRFGGHNTTTGNMDRWFDGYLDETVLFRAALSASEIGRLTNLPASYMGGMTITGTFYFTPPELKVTLIPTGAVWRYFDTGANLGTPWRGPNFDDSQWPQGFAQLGFGDGDESTVLNDHQQVTVYFRRKFVVQERAQLLNLTGRLLRDDGAVVYLNSNEVWRSNMPLSGGIDYLTLALTNAGGADETTNFHTLALSPDLLLEGTNLVAVEVHQNFTNSGDLSFDFELSGTRYRTPSNLPPEVLLTSPAPGQIVNWNGEILLAASARDSDGQVGKVELYSNGTKVGEALASTCATLLTNLSSGEFIFTARAYDNNGATNSAAVPVNLVPPGPSLQIIRQGQNLSLLWPAAMGVFDVYWTTNLWQPIFWNLAAEQPQISGTNYSVVMPVSANSARFYRLQSR